MSRSRTRFPAGALFDLDGTLLDSAPDMLATVNRMRSARSRPALALADIRPVVSRGARAMAAVAFPEIDAGGIAALVPEFLAVYAEELGRHGAPFDGVEPMLAALEAAGTRWGIVTNKPEYLAARILPQLGWQDRCAVLVGGDTLAERKPHPLPLLHAAEAIGVPPGDCVYVGDDARDVVCDTFGEVTLQHDELALATDTGRRFTEEHPAGVDGDPVDHELGAQHALLDEPAAAVQLPGPGVRAEDPQRDLAPGQGVDPGQPGAVGDNDALPVAGAGQPVREQRMPVGPASGLCLALVGARASTRSATSENSAKLVPEPS